MIRLTANDSSRLTIWVKNGSSHRRKPRQAVPWSRSTVRAETADREQGSRTGSGSFPVSLPRSLFPVSEQAP